MFLEANKIVGHSGTWGPGCNSFVFVHIKDLTAGILKIFEAALEGKADEGREGYCESRHLHALSKRQLYNTQISCRANILRSLGKSIPARSATCVLPSS